MKKIALSIAAIALVAFISCKDNKQKDEEVTTSEEKMEEVVTEQAKTIQVDLASKSGSTANGKLQFSELNGVVTLEAKFAGLTPGMHAIHIHEKADCSAEDGTSTGGHWNPTFAPHGKWGAAEGYHRGDIGNFEADASGGGYITMQTDEWCIGCDDETKNVIGKAIIVHAAVDDFTTQPTGNAGGRVSCGGIIE
jgi:Cu-Zn family superoxide dismutase